MQDQKNKLHYYNKKTETSNPKHSKYKWRQYLHTKLGSVAQVPFCKVTIKSELISSSRSPTNHIWGCSLNTTSSDTNEAQSFSFTINVIVSRCVMHPESFCKKTPSYSLTSTSSVLAIY